MTKQARVVLQDAKWAIAQHTNLLQSEAFRVSWLSIVTTLRAVGHVLKNVDAQSSPHLERAIEDKWSGLVRSRPEPSIFWGFIEGERNRFLKNYRHGITRYLEVPGPVHKSQSTILRTDVANSRGGEVRASGGLVISHLADGPYAGRAETSVALEAHRWWEVYLDEVDELAAEYEVS